LIVGDSTDHGGGFDTILKIIVGCLTQPHKVGFSGAVTFVNVVWMSNHGFNWNLMSLLVYITYFVGNFVSFVDMISLVGFVAFDKQLDLRKFVISVFTSTIGFLKR